MAVNACMERSIDVGLIGLVTLALQKIVVYDDALMQLGKWKMYSILVRCAQTRVLFGSRCCGLTASSEATNSVDINM